MWLLWSLIRDPQVGAREHFQMRRLTNDFIFWLPPSQRPFLKHYTTILHRGEEVSQHERSESVSGGVLSLWGSVSIYNKQKTLKSFLWFFLNSLGSVHLNLDSASLFCSFKEEPTVMSSTNALGRFRMPNKWLHLLAPPSKRPFPKHYPTILHRGGEVPRYGEERVYLRMYLSPHIYFPMWRPCELSWLPTPPPEGKIRGDVCVSRSPGRWIMKDITHHEDFRRGVQLAFPSSKLIACHPQDGWPKLICWRLPPQIPGLDGKV